MPSIAAGCPWISSLLHPPQSSSEANASPVSRQVHWGLIPRLGQGQTGSTPAGLSLAWSSGNLLQARLLSMCIQHLLGDHRCGPVPQHLLLIHIFCRDHPPRSAQRPALGLSTQTLTDLSGQGFPLHRLTTTLTESALTECSQSAHS